MNARPPRPADPARPVAMVRRMRRLLLLSVLLSSTALAKPALQARDQNVQVGEGGDAVLPAGYQNVVWGASAAEVMAVRERPLETLSDPDPAFTWLLEYPERDAGVSTIKYRLLHDKLYEVQVFYEGGFSARDAREFARRFEERYGDATYDRDMADYVYGRKELTEERWRWQDPFSLQLLRHTTEPDGWTLVRISRVLEAERMHALRKGDVSANDRVKHVELD